MAYPIFSGIDELPCGSATSEVTPGCMVLEGGAFRGVYGEGVLDAFMEAGVNLECTVGVSAGAMNGVNYVSGQIGRSARVNLRYRHDSRYISMFHRRRYEGIINFDFVLRNLPGDPFDSERFYNGGQRFFAVATNCLTGEPTYFEQTTCSDIFRAVQASASMPYISKLVGIDGVPYLDGGCSTKIAYRWALEQGFDKIVIVRTRMASWRYEDVGDDKTARRFYHAYPQFAEVLAGSNRRYNAACDEIERLVQQGRVFAVAPSRDLGVKRLEKDMEKLGALYYLGYEDGKNALPELEHYLQA